MPHRSQQPVSTHTACHESRSAVTLLELLLVIVILSVFVGLSMPRIQNNLKKMRLRSATHSVYLLLDYAKSHALLANAPLTARIDPATDSVSLHRTDGAQALIKHMEVSFVDLESVPGEIPFFPDGTMGEFTLQVNLRGAALTDIISSKGFDGTIVVQ